MFSSGPNYSKLKTNLRLSINRLKLLEKKKSELAQKARKEIADYIASGKVERAKIRVEHIIREDYLVEAMEVTEMYCDLLLARFGLIQQMKDLDDGLAEAISSLIWVSPRLQTDVAELKIIADHLSLKYGKIYAQACREQQVDTISEKLIHKLSVQAPPKLLVEKYLMEIARNYNVEYEPDPQILREGEWGEDALISLEGTKNNFGDGGATGGPGGPSGGIGMNIAPMGFDTFGQGISGNKPFDYPQKSGLPDPMTLPNVPDMPGYRPPGPPPPDMSADTMPNNMNPNIKPGGAYTPSKPPTGGAPGSQWDELMGLDNSPPPPYSSMDHNLPPPSAPPPSLSPHSAAGGSSGREAHPQFPPDVSSLSGNLKENNQPKPSPRSKFDITSPEFTLPDLPSVPDEPKQNSPSNPSNDDIDFDDLNKRFEQLKKRK